MHEETKRCIRIRTGGNRLGIPFTDKTLLEQALTHSSYANEHRWDKHMKDNERLEFLGDAVLEVVTSEFLVSRIIRRCRRES